MKRIAIILTILVLSICLINETSGQILGFDDNYIFSADFDNDGDVDGQDFLTWQKGYEGGTLFSEGDTNLDNVINQEDLVIVQDQFGQTKHVSEPSTIVILSIVLPILLLFFSIVFLLRFIFG